MEFNRRHLLAASAGAFVLAGDAAGAHGKPKRAAAKADPHAEAVREGVAYFRKRNAEQKRLVEALTAALASGNRATAEAAYVTSRAPYEEIEVLAADFEEIDKDIDARPYAHGMGEADPDYRGFHKIEALLFGDGDLAAAASVSRRLEASVAALDGALAEPKRFSAASSFKGMISLATEIGAKKISGEEETWSDRSLLIFRHNLIGIRSQFQPFEPALRAKKESLAAEVTRRLQLASATVDTVFGAEAGGAAYSRVGIGERRAIVRATAALRGELVNAGEVLGLPG